MISFRWLMKGPRKEGKQIEFGDTNRWIYRGQSLLRCCSVFPSPLSDLKSKDDWNTHQGLGEICAQAVITATQNTGLKQFKAKRKLIWRAKKNSLINWGKTWVLKQGCGELPLCGVRPMMRGRRCCRGHGGFQRLLPRHTYTLKRKLGLNRGNHIFKQAKMHFRLRL